MAWYTTQQVAKEFGVTIRTVERWRVTGVFVPKVRTSGNHSRYSEKQVRDRINQKLLERMML
jgi:DNA-binding transcriptional MerR regulator